MTTEEPGRLSADDLFRRLATRIAEGTYRPGSKLSDKSLAQDLGVTRTPMREAIQRLARPGLMDVHANRFSQVTEITQERSRVTREFAAFHFEEIIREAMIGLSEQHLDLAHQHIRAAIDAADSGKGWVPAHVDLFDFLTQQTLSEIHRLLLSDFWYLVVRDLYLREPRPDTKLALQSLSASMSSRDAEAGVRAIRHIFE